jgi:shikimate dehydrogenase
MPPSTEHTPAAAPGTRLTLCGSLSRHAVSTGAAMHLAGYAALGLAFTYVPFEVRDLPGAVQGMRALGIRGLGVSMPFKQEVIPLPMRWTRSPRGSAR